MRRVAELTAGGIGLLCCMATSSPDGPGEPPPDDFVGTEGGETDLFFDDIQADLVLHNETDEDVVVRIPTAQGPASARTVRRSPRTRRGC